MRVVLDTHVFVSGLITPTSPPGRILDHWQASPWELLLSEATMAELSAVLGRPEVAKYFRRSPEWIGEFLARTRERAVFVEPAVVRVILADPPDDLILGTTVAGAADYLVSGNAHLLDLGRFRGIPIVTPRQFLDVLDSDLDTR